MKRTLVTLAALVGAPAAAHAFCGFYVSPGDQPMFNDATQVVLMRQGTRTVLSMQNNYKGPTEAFAMVIPVPVVLHEEDVKTLPQDVFAHVEQMGAPRLVEYWEQDPCRREEDDDEPRALRRYSGAPKMAMKKEAAEDLGVTVEASFAVGEYQIVVLSAKDSTGLETWLHQEHYQIPNGAAPLLRPYIEGGMKFFVAKVDPTKVRFENGRAALSPLRFHYESEEFSLPIRLGLANSSGTQDLIVNILAPGQRYEVANYDNVTIPTNIDVKESVKEHFGAFYTALFDRTVEKHPGAVITEYAWQATTCDPCPGPALNYHDFTLLGADVVGGAEAPPSRRGRYGGGGFVLTRLHARYGKDVKDDLRFRAAPPIVGGREHVISDGKLEQGARPDSTNNFQGRYAIRHPWTGPIACTEPKRGIWGGPPGGSRIARAQPAMNLAFAPRADVQLQNVVERDLPEIGIRMGETPEHAAALPSDPTVAPKRNGCACNSSDPAGLGLFFAALFGCCSRPMVRRRPRPARTR